MENENTVSNIDDRPVTMEQMREGAKWLLEKALAFESENQFQAPSPVREAV